MFNDAAPQQEAKKIRVGDVTYTPSGADSSSLRLPCSDRLVPENSLHAYKTVHDRTHCPLCR